MGLLETVLLKSGGMDLWRLTRRFTAHISMTGTLCAEKCPSAQLKELAVEGSTQNQSLEITGFAAPQLRALYRPDWVALEGPDERRVMERQAAPAEFRSGLKSATWDELQLAHFCSYLIWNYITAPFILADPDFVTKELRRKTVRGELMSRLRVAFPSRVVTHAAEQLFYFDREGLLRRLDYQAAHEERTQIAQVFSEHQRFSGILIPTLCRLSCIGPDAMPVSNPPLLDIEIFDVNFG